MLKDEKLYDITHNVAQFVSFSPEGVLRYARVRGLDPDYVFSGVEDAVTALKPMGRTVNVRSFLLEQQDGNPFLYGLSTVEAAVAAVRSLGSSGYYTIVNETLSADVRGTCSGVSFGGWVEFAAADTPRCVEKPGFTGLRLHHALHVIDALFGHVPPLREFDPLDRVEWSVHPEPVGVYSQRHVIWQVDRLKMSLPSVPRLVPGKLGEQLRFQRALGVALELYGE